jgi:uncharacterized repeat protein (TIGR02543 family)
MRELPYLKITFDTNGAKHIPGMMIRLGIEIPQPKDPVLDGYIFAGWYKDCMLRHRWNFCKKPRHSMKLYAKWVQNRIDEVVSVTFNANGGTPVPPVQKLIKGERAKIPVPEPTKAGYLFGGWYTAAGNLFDFRTQVTADLTLTAQWEEIPVTQWTVTFDAQGGTPEPAAQTIPDGGTVTRPTDPSKSGFTFSGWYKNGAAYSFGAEVHESFTLTAQWDVPVTQWTITFDAQGGTPEPAPQTIPDGGTVTRPTDPSKSGFTFSGWYKNGVAYDFGAEVHESFTLTAQWEEIPVTQWTITFDTQGGTPEPAAQTIPDGGTVSEPSPDPSKSGFTFSGWYKNGVAYDFDTQVHESFTLTAQWEEIPVTQWTVTFDAQGGTPEPAAQTIPDGGMVTRPTDPTRNEYTFNNWYTEPEGGEIYNFSAPVQESFTLYAHWVSDEGLTYVVGFNSDGGSKVPYQLVLHGMPAEEPDDPTKAGFVFNGWFTYDDEPWVFTTPITEDIILYAHWSVAGAGRNFENWVTYNA